MMTEFLTRLRFLISRKKPTELDDELRFHLEQSITSKVAVGMSDTEARRQALIEFGGIERAREQCEQQRPGFMIGTLVQDMRYALRLLLKSPAFTIVALLTMAVGIGANTVVFSVMNAVVLRPLNVPQAQGLYTIEEGKDNLPMQSYPDYIDLRDRNSSFDGMAAYIMAPAGLNTGKNPSAIWLNETSGNYFDLLNIHPYLGRFFHISDEHGPNSAPYLVLSYGYWRSHFQGNPNVLGQTVQLNKHPFTILGIAPSGFRGTELLFEPAAWVPIVNQGIIEGWNGLDQRTSRGITLIGHLKVGATPVQATADLNTIATFLAKTYPKEDTDIRFSLARPGLAGDMLGRPVRAFVSGLMLLSGLILLAACSNLGNLFAARVADRSREFALRLALGSSRQRILRQLLMEAALISLIGGAIGMMGSLILLRWLSIWRPVPNIPINLPLEADVRVYSFALLVAFASGLLFGMVPVRKVFGANPYQVVKNRSSSADTRRIAARDFLLILQIGICAVLVTSSLVAVRGLARSLHSDFGFVPQNAMLVETDLDMAGYSGNNVATMQQSMVDGMGTIPGVTAAGMVDRPPLSLGWTSTTVFQDNVTDLRSSNAAAEAMQLRVSPEYLKASGTALLAGRAFSLHDDNKAPRVALVNREFARRVFGSVTDAVGKYYKLEDGTRIQVIGLIQDGKYRTITEDPQTAMFFPILQSPSSSTWLVIRSMRDPQQLAMAIDRTLRQFDAGLPFTIKTWNRELDSALFASRVATVSLGALGGLGAVLAVTGIFGMASYSVSKRLRELGVRIALGAQRKEVLQTVLGRAFQLLAVGSMAGLLMAIAANKILSAIVYQATSRDPLVLAGVICTMLLLGILATLIPAQRALSADPLALLREE
jgi:predicted permease